MDWRRGSLRVARKAWYWDRVASVGGTWGCCPPIMGGGAGREVSCSGLGWRAAGATGWPCPLRATARLWMEVAIRLAAIMPNWRTVGKLRSQKDLPPPPESSSPLLEPPPSSSWISLNSLSVSRNVFGWA